MAKLWLSKEELLELKKALGTVGAPSEELAELIKKVDTALFQETFEGGWFKYLDTDAVYQSFEVDREQMRVWFFDPDSRQEMYLSLTEIGPATEEEIKKAAKHYEEMDRRYAERCKVIESYMKEKMPNCAFIPVDRLRRKYPTNRIVIEDKVYGEAEWSGWPNSYHYVVNMGEL